MGILKELLVDYERRCYGYMDRITKKHIEGPSIELHIPEEFRKPSVNQKKLLKRDIREGDVLEIDTELLPVLLTVVEKGKVSVKVALMCDCWELATDRDVLVSFSHPIRDVWMVETDITYNLPLSMVKNFSLAGKLNKSDLETVKLAIKGMDVPLHRRGRGYNDPIHRRFKEIEKDRANAIFKTFIERKEKGECIVIEFSPDFKEFLMLGKENLMVASSQQESFETESFQGLFIPDEKKVVLLPKDGFYGKKGKVKIKADQSSIEIYRGTLKDIEIRNSDKELFEVIKSAEVEVDRNFTPEETPSQEGL
jgi:hypothetical protein